VRSFISKHAGIQSKKAAVTAFGVFVEIDQRVLSIFFPCTDRFRLMDVVCLCETQK
jgi:hypothetical protein